MKKILVYVLILMFTVGAGLGGFNIFRVYDAYKQMVVLQEPAELIEDTARDIDASGGGKSINGKMKVADRSVSYDEIFDDDTTGDGYSDRRTYYSGARLVLAAWDRNRDQSYDMFFYLSEGVHISEEYIDEDMDGLIDTVLSVNREGEVYATDDLKVLPNEVESVSITHVATPIDLILYIGIPLYTAVMIFLLLIILLVSKRARLQILSLLLCVSMVLAGMSTEISAQEEMYDENGEIDMEVFERDWVSYSDIDETIPLSERSYEAQMLAQSEEWVIELYDQMATLANDMALNREEYIGLTEFKDSIVKVHRSNLVKSIIRLSIFTAVTVKDAKGSAESFADNILKSSATAASNVGEVLEVTSSYVTDDYKDDFGYIQKGVTYYNADSKLEQVKSDAKDYIKEKVSEKLNVDKLNYSIDDMKISEEDVKILRAHFEKNRELDDAILQNRVLHKYLESQLEAIDSNLQEELSAVEDYRQAEKDRVYSLLSQKGPDEDVSENNQDEADTSVQSEDAAEEEVTFVEDISDLFIGTWDGQNTIVEVTLEAAAGMSEEEKQHLLSRVGEVSPVTFTIDKGNNDYTITDLYEVKWPVEIEAGVFTSEMRDVDGPLSGTYYLNGTYDEQSDKIILVTEAKIVFIADDGVTDMFSLRVEGELIRIE